GARAGRGSATRGGAGLSWRRGRGGAGRAGFCACAGAPAAEPAGGAGFGCGRGGRGAMVLCPVIRKLQHKRVVLASASPRRREILSNAVSPGARAGAAAVLGGPGRTGGGQGGPGRGAAGGAWTRVGSGQVRGHRGTPGQRRGRGSPSCVRLQRAPREVRLGSRGSCPDPRPPVPWTLSPSPGPASCLHEWTGHLWPLGPRVSLVTSGPQARAFPLTPAPGWAFCPFDLGAAVQAPCQTRACISHLGSLWAPSPPSLKHPGPGHTEGLSLVISGLGFEGPPARPEGTASAAEPQPKDLRTPDVVIGADTIVRFAHDAACTQVPGAGSTQMSLFGEPWGPPGPLVATARAASAALRSHATCSNVQLNSSQDLLNMQYQGNRTCTSGGSTTVDGLILEKPVDKQDAYRMLSSPSPSGVSLWEDSGQQGTLRGCLLRLSGKEHSVFTGVAIVHCSSKALSPDRCGALQPQGRCEKPLEDPAGQRAREAGLAGHGGLTAVLADGQLDTEVTSFFEETRVQFSELSEAMLWDYIDSGEPMREGAPARRMSPSGSPGLELTLPTSSRALRAGQCARRGCCRARGVEELAGRGGPAPGGAPWLQPGPRLRPAPGPRRDKAGGYGIQALGGMLVEAVRGDFLNVVGFPLNHFCKALARLYLPGGQDGARDADCNRALERPAPHPKDLLELIDGFKASKVPAPGARALFTACRLKVFDLLRDEAPLMAGAVAHKIDASLSGTERLLDACVALGLLEKTERGKQSRSGCRRKPLRDVSHPGVRGATHPCPQNASFPTDTAHPHRQGALFCLTSAHSRADSCLRQGCGCCSHTRTLEQRPLTTSRGAWEACRGHLDGVCPPVWPQFPVALLRGCPATPSGDPTTSVPAGYSNAAPATLYLVSDAERSLHSLALHNDDHDWALFTHLHAAVREGAGHTRWAFGGRSEDLGQARSPCSPEKQVRFLQAMHGLAELTAPQVATAFDLSRFTSACDLGGVRPPTHSVARAWARPPSSGPKVAARHRPLRLHPRQKAEGQRALVRVHGRLAGARWGDAGTAAYLSAGGTGALAHALARAYPQLQLTVFDLPEVVRQAPHFQPGEAPAGRVRFVPGTCSPWGARGGYRPADVTACVCPRVSVCVQERLVRAPRRGPTGHVEKAPWTPEALRDPAPQTEPRAGEGLAAWAVPETQAPLPGSRGPSAFLSGPGDFFQDELPAADLYVLSGVLQDWPDEQAHRLLSRVADRCAPGEPGGWPGEGTRIPRPEPRSARREPPRSKCPRVSPPSSIAAPLLSAPPAPGTPRHPRPTPSCRAGAGLLLVETALDTAGRAARLRALDVLLRARGGARPRAELARLLRGHGFGDVRVAPAGELLDVLLGVRVPPDAPADSH
ncbi:putative bifunctional dTTP/UTP pyrophosphatase/methyltransferase protein, partial [Galemys pyrenaicus]